MVQADFTYLVENAEKAILGVDKYEESINESAKSTLASILTGHKFADLNTFTMNPSQVIPAENPAAQSSDRSQFLSTIAHSFLDKLHEVCESWGIKVSNLRIVSVEAKDPQIGNAIAQTALTYLQSQNQLAAAKAKAAITETEARAAALQRQIKADAKAYARITQAKSEIDAAAALNDAANKLTNPIAQSMYGMKNRENIASALSATQGTLAIGSKFALFPSANSSNSLSSLPNRPGMVNG
jgi:regulator of protease activity HflC (stomatin/prohibitin superfamily)